MNNLPSLRLRATGALFLLAIASAAQAAEVGTIEGRVLDAARGEYLEKALVSVEGTRRETLTDPAGQFRLANVPAGTVRVKVFFTGMVTQTLPVIVMAGKVAQVDVTLVSQAAATGPVVKLDQFVVATSKEMEGAAIAINEQRFASNIVNVVAADEFGTISDGSIGEFMKFLPGITANYSGGDARTFSISGVPAENVPVAMGGFDMASAAGAGTARVIELDQASINNIARVEVSRSPTPESSGSALAGSVNLVPRSAFERSRPLYSYSASFLMRDAERAFGRRTPGPWWGQKSYKIHPGFDVSAVVPVTKNFGFTVSGGYSLQYTPQSFGRPLWRGAAAATNTTATSTTGLPATEPTNPYLGSFAWRDGGKDTTRHSFATTVDWRPAPRDRLAFGFSYGMLLQHYANHDQTYTINRVEPLNWSADHTWGSMSTFPPTGTAINAGNVVLTNGGRIRYGRTIMPSLRWLHEGRVWKGDVGVSYGNSRIHFQDIDKGFFSAMTIQRNFVQVLFDDIFYLRPGRITLRDPDGRTVNPSRLESYSLVSAASQRQITYDTARQAYAKVRRDFMVGENPASLKLGADIKSKVRDLRGVGTETYTYVGADGRASTTPVTQAGLANDDSPLPFLDVQYSERIPDFGLPKQQQVDNMLLWQNYQRNPTHWTRSANTDYRGMTNASKVANEVISSLFVRGDVAFFHRRLKLVGGLRAEQTNIKAQGPLTDPTRAFEHDATGNIVYQRNADGTFVVNAAGQKQPVLTVPTTAGLPYSQLTLLDRGYWARKEYLRLFPSLNVSCNVTEPLIVRAAYYQTVGRPDFNQYAGGLTLPNVENFNPNDRITVNNVSIKAWQAATYMARLEYYFGNVGQFSIGGFIRDFKGFFQNVTTLVTPEFLAAYGLDFDTYGQYPVATQFNDPDTIRMTGFEIDYKQALTFLPHWGRGLQFFANVSSQRAKGTDNFQDMNPFTANWGLSLTRPKFNIRINENYRGIQRRSVVTGASIEPGTYNYRPKRLYVDVSGEYYLSRRFGLFVTLRNITGATEDQKAYGPHTPKYARFRQRDDYGGSLWSAGVKGSF